MRGLALYLKWAGKNVSGSDRLVDKKMEVEAFSVLRKAGIKIYSQDGSGVKKNTDYLVMSTAVEEDNPDLIKGKKLGIKIIHRSDLLACLFNSHFGIAIGGTSGKTTTSALVVHLLKESRLDPSFCIGGEIINYRPYGSVGFGKSEYFCIEADESDGTIEKYKPRIGIITNISRDHMEVNELKGVFGRFAENCIGKIIICTDNDILKKIDFKKVFANKELEVHSYGIKIKADTFVSSYSLKENGSVFYINKKKFRLNIPGLHNIYNALPAVIVGKSLGLSESVIYKALFTFPGVKRRFQLIGKAGRIKVIDDFAHSPEKIKATLELCRSFKKRIVAIYQPHGFMPAYKHREGFSSAWKKYLTKDDILIIPDIYYVGGTVPEIARSISSVDLVKDAKASRLQAYYFKERSEIIKFIRKNAKSDDLIVVMGARDDSLTDFCRKILENLKNR